MNREREHSELDILVVRKPENDCVRRNLFFTSTDRTKNSLQGTPILLPFF